jgi:hypothetical protein
MSISGCPVASIVHDASMVGSRYDPRASAGEAVGVLLGPLLETTRSPAATSAGDHGSLTIAPSFCGRSTLLPGVVVTNRAVGDPSRGEIAER